MPLPGEDFQIIEHDPTSPNTADSVAVKITAGLPLETCMTINRSSGYDSRDKEFKVREIIHALVSSAPGANSLLSISPRPDGLFEHEALERLQEVGAWLKTHGETVLRHCAGARLKLNRGAFPPPAVPAPLRKYIYMY